MLYNPQSRQNEIDINIKSENTNIIIGVNLSESGVRDMSEDKSSSRVYLDDIISTGIVPIKQNIKIAYNNVNTNIMILKFLYTLRFLLWATLPPKKR